MRNLFLINYRFCLFESVKSRHLKPVEAKLFDKLNIIACINTYREKEGKVKEEKDEERKKIKKKRERNKEKAEKKKERNKERERK